MRGTNLLGQGGELEDGERLIVGGRTLADVDDHAHGAATAQEALQEVGELGLPEGNVLRNPRGPTGGGAGERVVRGADTQC